MRHFESLVLMAMRNEPLSALKTFRDAVNNHKPHRAGRRTRT